MTESATYIADLDATLPAAATSPASADDHIRLLKSVLRASFPNISGAVTASDAELNIADGLTVTAAELNKMVGVTVTAAEIEFADALTSAVQTQLAAKRSLTTNVKTAAFTAVVGYMHVIRAASAANVAVTLPASATAGDEIRLVNSPEAGRGNGFIQTPYTINGTAGVVVLSFANQAMKLVYVDSTTGWAKHDA